MTQEIPEDSWPTIPIVSPKTESTKFMGEILDLDDEDTVDIILDFYHETLIPQLACAPDGSSSAHPQKGWMMSPEPPRKAVVIYDEKGMRGVWILKEGQIYYPCATVEDISGVFRALWAESIQHFDHVWGSTSNPVIMAFAQAAVQKTRWYGTPEVNDERIEWRRPDADIGS